ncbi:lytic polysaccharide monooxygenase, partial [Auriscalpium vulgare]
LPYVSAHGFLTQVTIDGKPYQGNAPGDNHPFASPIRQVTDVSPIKGASNAALTCGLGAQAASTVAPANPGDRVDFHWGDLNNQPWIHDTGPMMTYMALCDGSTCDKFDAQSAKWFKIDQIGKKPSNDSDANPVWYQVDVQKNQSVSVTLPKDIAPGDYLIRHEIIALHLATSIGGAEFYPSCTQVRVGGSGSGTPSSTVSFPGGYNDTEPGIFDADIFNPGDKYVFPGPPLSNIASSS